MIKIIYEDIPKFNGNKIYTGENKLIKSNLENLNKEKEIKNYATLGELNQLLLNGTKNISDDLNIAVWSENISDENCFFNRPLKLNLSFSELINSAGFTIKYEDNAGNFATKVRVNWYKNNVLIKTIDYNKKGTEQKFIEETNNFDKIEVLFIESCFPFSFIKIKSFNIGVNYVFSENIKSCSINEEIDLLSSELSINTMDFEVNSDEEIFIFNKKTNPVRVYFNDSLKGVFYPEKITRKNELNYSFSCYDIVSQLDDYHHDGYTFAEGNSFIDILNYFNTLFPFFKFEIEEELKSVLFYGFIQPDTLRDTLKKLCFVAGAVLDTSSNEKIKIFKLKNEIKHTFTKEDIFDNQLTKDDGYITEIKFTTYNYEYRESWEDYDEYELLFEKGKECELVYGIPYKFDPQEDKQFYKVYLKKPYDNFNYIFDNTSKPPYIFQYTAYFDKESVDKSNQYQVYIKYQKEIKTTCSYKLNVPVGTKEKTIKIDNLKVSTDLTTVKNNTLGIFKILENYYMKNQNSKIKIVSDKKINVGDKINYTLGYKEDIGYIKRLNYNLIDDKYLGYEIEV